jgi:hypothetical protein
MVGDIFEFDSQTPIIVFGISTSISLWARHFGTSQWRTRLFTTTAILRITMQQTCGFVSEHVGISRPDLSMKESPTSTNANGDTGFVLWRLLKSSGPYETVPTILAEITAASMRVSGETVSPIADIHSNTTRRSK